MTIQNTLGLKVIDKKSCMYPKTTTVAGVTTWPTNKIAVNMNDYPVGAKGVLLLCGANKYLPNGTDTTACEITMKDSGGTTIATLAVNQGNWPAFDIKSSVTPFSLNSGLDYYYFVTNAYTDVVSKIELYIVLEW